MADPAIVNTSSPSSTAVPVSDTARLFDLAIRRFGQGDERTVLDFGCGAGALVRDLGAAGYDSYGADFEVSLREPQQGRIRQIVLSPNYTLPYPDEYFDVIVSTSVLEHAQNKRECFLEMKRVLKPGGLALHLFPARRYFPKEPHIYVPLANWWWPRTPSWWFSLWALLGTRNESQQGQSWKQTAAGNREYFASGLSYWPTADIERLSREIFGNCEWPTRFYLEHANGGFARRVRRLPVSGFWDYLSREFRYSFLLMRKPR